MNEEFIETTLKTAIETYGEHNQQAMAIEEMAELIKAICKFWRNPGTEEVEQIREEMADVEIMLYQLRVMFGETRKIREKKIHRLFHRLGKEKEESASSEAKWIPCSEKMPEYNEEVLIRDFDENMHVARRIGYDGFYDSSGDRINNVKAWMEIPEAWPIVAIDKKGEIGWKI